jgi:hypothetical protein
MTNYEQTTAHEVHTLLLSARSEPNDIHLAKAASLASASLTCLYDSAMSFEVTHFSRYREQERQSLTVRAQPRANNYW